MTALKKMMMKRPPKPPHSAARHQHNGDISRRLDIVSGDAQGPFTLQAPGGRSKNRSRPPGGSSWQPAAPP
jgi:hypothetical protein